MRIHRFFVRQDLSPALETELEHEVFKHAVRALRLKSGDSLSLFNGDGCNYPATLIRVTRESASVRIDRCEPCTTESPLSIHLGLGISKSWNMDLAIQKSVELGVSGITPVTCQRTVSRLEGSRLERRLEHWNRIAIAACEQSGRSRIPQVSPPLPLAKWVALAHCGERLLLDHRTEAGLQSLSPATAFTLLTGPEGGTTEEERQLSLHHGFQPIRLGPRVLRTESAPLAAVAAIQTLWGDLV